MSRKISVTSRFLKNPEKYKSLVAILAAYDDPEKLASERLRIVYTSVFYSNPTTSEISQLRSFIYIHKNDVLRHIRLYKNEPNSMILLKDHYVDISNKIKLYDVVKNLYLETQNYKLDFLRNVMRDAWGLEEPTNGLSLAKSFVRNQFEANKENNDLSIPEICKGYRIIKNELVHFDSINTKKFRDMGLLNKAKNMLKWLNFTEEYIDSLLFGQTSIKISQIDENINISDAFLDDNVDLYILENFFKIDAFEKLKSRVESKKLLEIYTCRRCVEVAISDVVQCDSCLLWYHYHCVNINKLTDIRQLKKIDWYCDDCK